MFAPMKTAWRIHRVRQDRKPHSGQLAEAAANRRGAKRTTDLARLEGVLACWEMGVIPPRRFFGFATIQIIDLFSVHDEALLKHLSSATNSLNRWATFLGSSDLVITSCVGTGCAQQGSGGQCEGVSTAQGLTLRRSSSQQNMKNHEHKIWQVQLLVLLLFFYFLTVMRGWLYLWLLRFSSSVCIGSVAWKLARSESEGGECGHNNIDNKPIMLAFVTTVLWSNCVWVCSILWARWHNSSI